MQLPVLCAVVTALLFQLASSTRGSHQAQGLTQLGTVINLLEDLLKESEEEKNEEEVQWASEKTFCDHSESTTTATIAKLDLEIRTLNVSITEALNDIDLLNIAIGEDEGLISTSQDDKHSLTTERETQRSTYEAARMNYTAAIDALKAAIAILEKQDYSRPQSFVQSDIQQQTLIRFRAQLAVVQTMLHIPTKATAALAAFLQDEDAADVVGAPSAHAYEFQSGSIIGLLKELKATAIEQRTACEDAEATAKHNNELLMMDEDAMIKQATGANEDRAVSKARHEDAYSNDQKARDEATATLATANEYRDNLTAGCDEKAGNFATTQQARAGEIDVIKQAIDLLKSDDVKGYEATYLSAAQIEAAGHRRKAAALASLRASLPDDGENARRARKLLLKQAGRLHSDLLETIASKIQDDDPFAKVKTMIEELAARLEAEQLSKKEFGENCDTQLAQQQSTLNATQDSVNTLTATIDELTASIAEDSAAITEKSSELANLQADQVKAEDLQAESAKISATTINDSEAAIANILWATGNLTNLFASSQFPQESSKSIIVLLDLVHQSFVEVKTTAEATQQSDLDDHTNFKEESVRLQGEVNTAITDLTTSKEGKEAELIGHEGELGTQEEMLTSSQSAYEAVKADCATSSSSHKERTELRNQEIQSLEEVLEMLRGMPAAML